MTSPSEEGTQRSRNRCPWCRFSWSPDSSCVVLFVLLNHPRVNLDILVLFLLTDECKRSPSSLRERSSFSPKLFTLGSPRETDARFQERQANECLHTFRKKRFFFREEHHLQRSWASFLWKVLLFVFVVMKETERIEKDKRRSWRRCLPRWTEGDDLHLSLLGRQDVTETPFYPHSSSLVFFLIHLCDTLFFGKHQRRGKKHSSCCASAFQETQLILFCARVTNSVQFILIPFDAFVLITAKVGVLADSCPLHKVMTTTADITWQVEVERFFLSVTTSWKEWTWKVSLFLYFLGKLDNKTTETLKDFKRRWNEQYNDQDVTEQMELALQVLSCLSVL
jgi:hypothetical protein